MSIHLTRMAKTLGYHTVVIDPRGAFATGERFPFVDQLVHAWPQEAFKGIALDDESVFYFVGIDGARFKRPVEPGDQLVLHAAMDRSRGGIYKFKCHADVDGEVAAEAEIMCTMRKVV